MYGGIGEASAEGGRARVLIALTVGLVAALICGGVATATAPSAADVKLPDLNPSAPYNLRPQTVGDQQRLGFNSKFVNEGSYQLLLRGMGSGSKAAEQYYDGQWHSGAGELYFESAGSTEGGHNHWHYRKMLIFQLRSKGSDGQVIKESNKQGFCLSDLSSRNCNRGEPDRTDVTMGLGRGEEDVYSANVEGQYVTITDVPDGEYNLRFEVNPRGEIKESSTSDNYSSARIRITRSGTDVSAKILKSCSSSKSC
jgi:hypothetical protein